MLNDQMESVISPWFEVPSEQPRDKEQTDDSMGGVLRTEIRHHIPLMGQSSLTEVAIRLLLYFIVTTLLLSSFLTFMIESARNQLPKWGVFLWMYTFGLCFIVITYKLKYAPYLWRMYNSENIRLALYRVSKSQISSPFAVIFWLLVSLTGAVLSYTFTVGAFRLFFLKPGDFFINPVWFRWSGIVVLLRIALACFIFALRGIKSAYGAIWFKGEAATEHNSIPVILSQSTPKSKDEIILAHWSDLHITAGDDVRLVERTADGGNRRFRELLKRYKQVLESADLILITGDITDSGKGEEWRIFLNELNSHCPAALQKIIALPGNHDINITDPSDLRRLEGIDSDSRKLRLIRCLAALDLLQGERVKVHQGVGSLVDLRVYLKGQKDSIEEYVFGRKTEAGLRVRPRRVFEERYTSIGAEANAYDFREITPERDMALLQLPQQLWNKVFPLIVEFKEPSFAIALIDSNYPANNILSNAFGSISASSLAKLQRFHSTFVGLPMMYALHHHISIPKGGLKGLVHRIKGLPLCLMNAYALMDVLNDTKPTILFHGHRHISYWGTLIGGHQVISATSTTLGGQTITPTGKFQRQHSGFYSYRIRFSPEGDARIVSATWHG